MVSDSTYILDKETNHGNKIDELRELLPEIVENPDNKIVIFSQWKKMFELIIEELNALGLPYVYLNGDMPALERNQIITRFQKEKDLRVFLSTDAGGVGVNLQSANILINIDLPWNPAVLEQRIGRIYRLGQKKHINVFNFISKGSIEHRILYLLEFKKSVFSGAIDEDGNDTVMLEGFLSSVKSLTEVEVDEPVAKEREDSDTLNYRAELKVTDQIEETERAEEEIPEQQIHTETEAEIEIDTKTETGAEIGTGAENGTETATTEYPGNSEANPLVSTDRKTTGTGFLGKIKANVKRVFRKMFGLR